MYTYRYISISACMYMYIYTYIYDSFVWLTRPVATYEEYVITRKWNASSHALLYFFYKSSSPYSHVAQMSESCHTYESVVSHVWMSHVTCMNESCRTCEWVKSHIWVSRVTHMNQSCRTYEWVMSQMWMTHRTRLVPFSFSNSSYICICIGIYISMCMYMCVYIHMTHSRDVTHGNLGQGGEDPLNALSLYRSFSAKEPYN